VLPSHCGVIKAPIRAQQIENNLSKPQKHRLEPHKIRLFVEPARLTFKSPLAKKIKYEIVEKKDTQQKTRRENYY
jgi:hypothetical protein